jgi:tetratricopeptide (TPR) repeat protein
LFDVDIYPIAAFFLVFPKQSWVAFFHAVKIASMPFSTVIGLVLFGMLTAPPAHQKSPETLSEMLSVAESKVFLGEYEEALGYYDKIIAQSPEGLVLASAYWGRGATYLRQFTRVNTRVRSLRLKMRSDSRVADEFEVMQRSAQALFDRGVADHWNAAQVADASGLVACGQEIRNLLPKLPKGMVRYNNSYDIYLKRTLPRC